MGVSYIYVDWRTCAGCLACVESCDRQAIVARESAPAPAAAPAAPSSVGDRLAPVVAIGSRAEAKAAKKAAEEARRRHEREQRGLERRTKVSSIVEARAEALRADGMVRWTPVDAGAVLGVLLLSFIAKDAILSAGAVRLMPATGQAVARTLVLGAFYTIQLWLLGYLCARHGSRLIGGFGLGSLGRSWTSKLTSLGLVVGLALATRVATTAYGVAARAVGWAPPARANGDLTALFGAGGIGLALSIVLVVLVGPLAEELAFRGIILPVAGERWGRWPAIVVSAAVFSAYHFTLWLLVPTFVLGMALGWLAWERRSLWPAIALHAAYNATAVAAAFFVAAR